MFDVGQGNQILRPELRGHAQAAVRGQRDMKHASYVVQRLALDHPLPLGVDDRDF